MFVSVRSVDLREIASTWKYRLRLDFGAAALFEL